MTILALLTDWIARAAPTEGIAWFRQSLSEVQDERLLVRAFGLAPRRLGRAPLDLTPDDMAAADALRPGFDPTGLTIDQAARIALLLASHDGDDAAFADRLQSLIRTADLSESIALYRGLPLYPAPERLRSFAAEGLRTAVTPIFEAVAHRSPYPREMFDEDAWNQMVLKALFIGSTLAPIQGLDELANPTLAAILLDYAAERRAAGRPISPELWRCVTPFQKA